MTLYDLQVPGAQLLERLGDDVLFGVPREDERLMAAFFARLHAERARLAVADYGINNTTMEQIFLTVTDAHHRPRLVATGLQRCLPCLRPAPQQLDANIEGEVEADPAHPPFEQTTSPIAVFVKHVGAVFVKRAHCAKRKKLSMFVEV